MIFSSLAFFVFIAVVGGLFAAFKGDRFRRALLLGASFVFYGWWDWRFLLLITGSSVWSWWWGDRVSRTADGPRRKLYLWIGLCGDLGSLAFFKYADFFVQSFAQAFGIEHLGALGITLPVGISFFTFQTMSYTIDLYRGRIARCDDLPKFLLFVSFFPQLVAGPIVRASEFLDQLDRPVRSSAAHVRAGAQLFLLGFVQKTLVADNLSVFVDPVFAEPALYDTATLWLGMFAYGGQIFCDFAGYSLMAIGVARVFGFHLPENFHTPYLSRSITEFWRRWHITLSSWLRDYLYIALGGNRQGPVRTDVNLLLTMLLGGLWHGAGWNFVLWGGAHGLALAVHRHWGVHPNHIARSSLLRQTAGWAATLVGVHLLWVPFRAADFGTTWTFLQGLLGDAGTVRWWPPRTVALLAALAGWHALHLLRPAWVRKLPAQDPLAWGPLTVLALLVLGLLMFAPLEASPFIYFQF
ncbi:MAG: MBOAT family protein [Myxococcales bacterium]|nr:MBOAT family protein [Myxococcales bacterium]MCB9525054.1 MBOAT family protein [Myxococcales bacterium]